MQVGKNLSILIIFLMLISSNSWANSSEDSKTANSRSQLSACSRLLSQFSSPQKTEIFFADIALLANSGRRFSGEDAWRISVGNGIKFEPDSIATTLWYSQISNEITRKYIANGLANIGLNKIAQNIEEASHLNQIEMGMRIIEFKPEQNALSFGGRSETLIVADYKLGQYANHIASEGISPLIDTALELTLESTEASIGIIDYYKELNDKARRTFLLEYYEEFFAGDDEIDYDSPIQSSVELAKIITEILKTSVNVVVYPETIQAGDGDLLPPPPSGLVWRFVKFDLKTKKLVFNLEKDIEPLRRGPRRYF